MNKRVALTYSIISDSNHSNQACEAEYPHNTGTYK